MHCWTVVDILSLLLQLQDIEWPKVKLFDTKNSFLFIYTAIIESGTAYRCWWHRHNRCHAYLYVFQLAAGYSYHRFRRNNCLFVDHLFDSLLNLFSFTHSCLNLFSLTYEWLNISAYTCETTSFSYLRKNILLYFYERYKMSLRFSICKLFPRQTAHLFTFHCLLFWQCFQKIQKI